MPVGPPNITNIRIQTVGGITYFTHTSSAEVCRRVASGPVSRSGTNLFQTINEEEWIGICGCDLCVHSETHVSIFGALPSGDYFLQLSATAPLPRPFRWIGFSVPVSDTPALQIFVVTNYVRLAMLGITNVTYTTEVSSTLTNWTPVFTNVGGSFVWNEPIRAETQQRFYRVRINGD